MPDLIAKSDIVIICPSNPLVSIDPILATGCMHQYLKGKKVISISPIIQGRAVKGPLQKMLTELGFPASAKTIAAHYGSLLTAFILDTQDTEDRGDIERWGIIPFTTNIMMKDITDKRRLAEEVLDIGLKITG